MNKVVSAIEILDRDVMRFSQRALSETADDIDSLDSRETFCGVDAIGEVPIFCILCFSFQVWAMA